MFATLLLLAATATASCPQPLFEFTGQPDCVTLKFEDGKTHVTNACQHPILIDQSVQLQKTASAANAFVQAQTTAEIRDLAAFTLGMDGTLYRVVALISEPRACKTAG